MNIVKSNLLILFTLVILFKITTQIASASTCVQLNSDLSYGQTDSINGGPIMMLQTYLQLNGFFSSNPNGHFGPATLSAVKAFQSHAGISNTGYVGPMTRSSITQKTCSTKTNTVVSSSAQTSGVAPALVKVIANIDVTSPTTGQVLSTGSTTIIRWSKTPLNGFNITLEQPGGAGAGFIASNLSKDANGNQYMWRAGQIYLAQTDSSQNITPGTYRIRIQNPSDGLGLSDQTSGWFTILAQQFIVSSVAPSSAYADNTTSVVLFGSGFTNSASIYFDTNYSNMRGNNRYISPDGTILVFTIPTNVTAGSHTLYINNGQSSNPVTLPFTVNSIN